MAIAPLSHKEMWSYWCISLPIVTDQQSCVRGRIAAVRHRLCISAIIVDSVLIPKSRGFFWFPLICLSVEDLWCAVEDSLNVSTDSRDSTVTQDVHHQYDGQGINHPLACVIPLSILLLLVVNTVHGVSQSINFTLRIGSGSIWNHVNGVGWSGRWNQRPVAQWSSGMCQHLRLDSLKRRLCQYCWPLLTSFACSTCMPPFHYRCTAGG